MNALKHLHTINHHKRLVMQGCFAVGLYRQGLLGQSIVILIGK